ncbi:L domain-like protein [Heliocybe sulcata]|uniref:L domain-like protein n=1 Tax=Heliocybe sulcata TaxID=5364 RepID=A0A5C3MT12_9AGAM|nr:L domain-like protein [Heliocybe sulcata]
MLNLRSNRIETITGLESLPSLQLLNLENNQLRELDPSRPLPRLRILRVSGNRLHELHARGFPHLRTLYADDNYLDGLVKVGGMTKLENLSLRNQRGRLLNVSVRNVRDVKRLYLSGNPLKAGFLDEPCYNLTYLELAGCRLASLPTNMAKLVPNLRILNLNYNFLEDVRPLHGLARLRKLTVIGSRLKGAKDVIRVLRGMPEAEIVDFRMNPCTLAWYVPLLYRKGSGGARGESEWAGMDGEFRRGLPTEVYTQRMLYRGQVMRVCGGLRELDGLQVLQKERDKAAMLLAGARQGPGR